MVLLGFSVSLAVETIQLVTRVGIFDVDDLMLNTLGAALGYLVFAVCNRVRRKIYYGKKYKYSFTRDHEAKEGLEALVLSGISFAAFIVLAIISFAFSGKGGACWVR